MADISNKTLGVFVALAFFVSALSLFGPMGNWIFGITGLALSNEGQAKVNITENAALNITQALIDFGNGTIETGSNNCTLASDTATADPSGCFLPAWGVDGPNHGGFLLVNTGNTALNVTVIATKNATTFWGVSNGKYMYKCKGNGTIATEAAVYLELTAATQNCTRTLAPDSGSDGFTIDINITIPPTATGFKNDTITITGVKA